MVSTIGEITRLIQVIDRLSFCAKLLAPHKYDSIACDLFEYLEKYPSVKIQPIKKLGMYL